MSANPPDDAAPQKKIKPLAQLIPFLKPHSGTVLLALAALIVAAAATLAMPVAVRYMIDLGFSAENAAYIDRYFLALFGVASIMAVASALRFFWVSKLGERIVADIRTAVYSHVIKLSPEFFEQLRTGEVLSRLTTDTTLVQTIIGSSVSIALRNLFMLIGGLIMLIISSPKLAGLILVLIPAVLIPIITFGRMVRNLSKDSQDKVADTSALAGEMLNAVQTVQAFTHEKIESERYGEAVDISYQIAMRRITIRALMTVTSIMCVFGAVAFVLWMGANAVLEGTMTVGELSQFVLYAIIVAGSGGILSEVWGELQRAAGATERLMELLVAPATIVAPVNPIALPERSKGELSLEDVTFYYPSRTETPALKNFSLTIKPGETIALVGPSGAGKSTVFQLLLRFYDPQQGQISLDGINIREADPVAIRGRIGIVPQDTIVFAENALENIRFGLPEADDAAVRRAAHAAVADEFITRLPEQYDTFLGERGLRLSGGQKQRIAIARAILKNSPVMLLDEATSALDAESEQLVQAALEHLMENRTTLVIAHRLATVLKADRIVVMDQGEIVATGTHDELIRQEGLYARLARLQFNES